MPDSTYVYESGDPVLVGDHGDHSYVYNSGIPVTDSGESTLVFESDTGIGGVPTYDITQLRISGVINTAYSGQTHDMLLDDVIAEGTVLDDFEDGNVSEWEIHNSTNATKGVSGVSHSGNWAGDFSITHEDDGNREGIVRDVPRQEKPSSLEIWAYNQSITSDDVIFLWFEKGSDTLILAVNFSREVTGDITVYGQGFTIETGISPGEQTSGYWHYKISELDWENGTGRVEITDDTGTVRFDQTFSGWDPTK